MTYADIHLHTEDSVLDGMTKSSEAVAMAAAYGIPAIASTDHGNCTSHVRFQAECDKGGVKPLLGMESYFQPDRLIRPAEGDKEAQAALRGGRHLILIAQGDRGLHDLWAMSTESYATGFYGKPRLDWSLLEEYGGDLVATTACLGGMISQDLLQGRHERAFSTVDRLRSVFGDRLYLEVQPNELAEQRRLNQMLAALSEAAGIPLVVASDAHYPSADYTALHKLWMAMQAGSAKEDYWSFSPMLPEAHARELLAYLGPRVVDAAFRATLEIAERCTARIGGHADPPVFTPGGSPADDARHLRALCERGWHQVPDLPRYRDRMEREYEVVTGKGLAGCYLIVEDIVSWTRSQGILVGPGRGSAAGSLMSYLLGITSIDPVRADLMFERFLTPGRESLPDFDLDFPSSRRKDIQDYVIGRHGADCVVRVGTTLRSGAKRSLNKLATVMASVLPEQAQGDVKIVSKLIDEAEAGTAGLGLPWEEIVADPAIAEYAARYPDLFAVAEAINGRVYASGQHPAGLIISPGRPLAGTIPMRREEGGKGLMVSQWDFRAAEELGLLKLDMLTLRNLDSVATAISLVRERTGVALDPRSWDLEHGDPQVWDDIGTGQTAGMFQIETSLCRSYCQRMRPRSLGDLADLTTFIRPGPRNSGATESYLRRRSGAEPVDYPHPLLERHLERSYGVMLYQEDVLRACKEMAGYSDLEADGVRKILGKKLTSKVEAAGQEFTRRCAERGHDEEQARALWEKMAEFGKYAFNRAHGYSYAVLTFWTAWLKAHYPVEMLTAILSTLDDMDRMAEFAMEARRLGISVSPPDVRFSGADFTARGLSVTYGLSAIPKVGPAAIGKITAGQPYSSWEDFRDRSGVNAGVLRALVQGGALDALIPSRRGVMALVESDRDGTARRCVHKDDHASGPNGLPCSYDWASEPLPVPKVGKSGRLLKVTAKPPPATCRVSCRRYSPPASLDPAAMPEYRPSELYRQDREVYGCWMSPAPFEQLERRSAGLRKRAREIALAATAAREGTFPLAAILAEYHTARTRSGSVMWWVALDTEVATFSLACFAPRHDDDPDVPAQLRPIRPGSLVLADATRHSYATPGGATRTGWRLEGIQLLGT